MCKIPCWADAMCKLAPHARGFILNVCNSATCVLHAVAVFPLDDNFLAQNSFPVI